MKNLTSIFPLAFLFTLFFAVQGHAIVISNNTNVSPLNTSYDGQDIVISNCTVTIDGAHGFTSVTVKSNGTLAHSFSPSGQLIMLINVTNEQQILSGTTPATLNASNSVSTAVLVTDLGQTVVYTVGVDYTTVTNISGDVLGIARTPTSSIPDGATVLVDYTWELVVAEGLNLSVTNGVIVDPSSSINVNAIGYGPGQGQGRGKSSVNTYFDGSGGGDGGNGGMSASNAVGGVCYDSLYQPAALGSGGGASYAGNGGNGGGLVQIVAGGSVEIDGTITANGGNALNSRAGGGSGGGIWISATSVNGAGIIAANGGTGAGGYGGGGGGGRIAIFCGANTFSGTMTAFGGNGATYGGAGTIYTQLIGQTGLLLLNNGGNTGTNSTVTLSNLADVVVSGNAGLIPFAGFYPRNMTIGPNSTVTTTAGSLISFSSSNLTVQVGGTFSVNGLGGGSGQGVGGTYSANGYTFGGGGGHGGYGGAGGYINTAGGTTYDSVATPNQLGSSGGGANVSLLGGTGGSAVLLTVPGTLEIDGAITANGNNGFGTAGGGGSGGSILLHAGTISGVGTIAANGGVGANSLGGGGGGGRISINVTTYSFLGTINCYGGAGANPGGAGTLYRQTGINTPQLLLDNGGVAGPATPVWSIGSENLVIQNGASGSGGSSVTALNSLLVASNASLSLLGGSSSGGFTVAGDAIIQAGGGLIADFQGYPSGQGTGAGGSFVSTPSYPGGGGGLGGMGGSSATNLAAGGRAGYENIIQPVTSGAGGGGYTPYSIGGTGGGNVQLIVTGTLQLSGTISANGGNGSGSGGGGGSGGSIYLAGGIISGSGAISACGGAGVNFIGGGGGGGCVAIIFNTNIFSGPITAFGGSGANYGGAGTIYLKTNTLQNAQLTVDNAGHSGAGTLIQTLSSANLTARNSALIDLPAGSFAFANVLVSSNAQLVLTNNGSLTINANNINVQPGCGILANACGNAANSGSGAGRVYASSPLYPCSGAGNGGYGGNSATNLALGGVAIFYGQQNTPTTAGSGGGGETPYSLGGTGGGVIVLNVPGTLQLDGTLSANAGNGSGSGGGGGSGGSLDLSLGSLIGSGLISANGGSGAGSIGGGGGGGMIGINFTAANGFLTNSFNGAITAFGGGGANYGGAGTVFLRTNFNNLSLTIVDNGGNVGTNTGITSSSSASGLILRNGAIGSLNVSGQSFSSVLIASNAWLVPSSRTSGSLILSCNGNVTIQPGGGIIADAYGSAQNVGTGHGFIYAQGPYYPGGGGGHGGYGGMGISNLVAGGIAFDSTTAPNQLGSGGGAYVGTSTGGSGGGYVSLVVQTPFVTTINGIISANGGNGSGSGGGGGSGGSIAITTRTLTGTGSIIANGGSGAFNVGGGGGGGGGGRIEIFVNQTIFSKTNLFGGAIAAYGGGGASYGGAGTVYYLTNLLSSSPTVVLDNNGHMGTNTSFAFNNYDVTVQNGAIGLLPSSGSWTTHNITILSNSAMTVLPTTANITVQPNSLTIAQGGAMTLDFDGYSSQSGTGSGASSGSLYGGAGHGGYGGANSGGSGGYAYDSMIAPINAGSGGAVYQSTAGGAGGGSLTILGNSGSVTTVTVNGRLSANGASGGLNAGGGSGGSLYLNNIYSLAGGGAISANGGAASGMGGGGGGGRIAINSTLNSFTGQTSAYGGGGIYPGGAGTIYTASGSTKTLLVNNGGIAGTNTPLTSGFTYPASPFDLDISGAASVAVLSSLPVLSNLNLSAATTLTIPIAQSSLLIGVLNNANVGGNLNMDQQGYSLTNGPGAGSAINNDGSGAGYGGVGGTSSSAAPGGITYGIAAEPLALGSGGGNGAATVNGGSSGGGALRLSVLGTLNVTGNLSANGSAGAQDNSGGGSGGSVWITAGTLSGTGNISANGGNGVLSGGGGGGGGRIAIYTPTNNFAGTTNVNGGTGDVSGQPGTIFLANAFTDFDISSQSPTGQVMNTVSSVTLGFNDMVSAASVSASDFTLTTPAGTLASSNLSVVLTGPYSVQIGFPAQNLNGNYTIQATTISNMLGLPLAVPYSGTFTISLPAISGTITNTSGAPIAGVMVQPNGGLIGMMTDANGNYSIGVPNGWNGTMTPSLSTNMFVPGSLSYSNVTTSLANQNYLTVSTVAPNLTSSVSGNNFTMSWTGISGVTYQVLWSPDLINWQPLGSELMGTNGPMQISVPSNTNAAAYFLIQAAH